MIAIHSGNCGDVLYSIPTLIELVRLTNEPIDFFITIDHPAAYSEGIIHPMGNVYINSEMFAKVKPLLESQSTIIRSVSALPFSELVKFRTANEKNPKFLDLDMFRKLPVNYAAGCIPRWYFYIFNVYFPLWEQWLFAKPDMDYSDKIIINRTMRYRMHIPINFSFMEEFLDKIVFVGLDNEFDDFVKNGGPKKCKRVVFDNFLHLASAIAGCSLFYGNQSLCYTIAEGVKSRRILETCPCPHTNIPQGGECFDFCLPDRFEQLFIRLAKQERLWKR